MLAYQSGACAGSPAYAATTATVTFLFLVQVIAVAALVVLPAAFVMVVRSERRVGEPARA